MRYRNLVILLTLLIVLPNLVFCQSKELKSVRSTIEIISIQENEEYEFEICYVHSNEPYDTPLKVDEVKTPFKLDNTSYSIIAIVRCENSSTIKSSIITFDKTGKQVSAASGSAPRFILRKSGDQVEFSSM